MSHPTTPEPEEFGLPDDIHPQGAEADGEVPGAGHEVSDIRPRPILFSGLALAALAVVAVLVLSLIMNGFAARQRKSAELRPALFAVREGLYPAPNLQDNPAADMTRMNLGVQAEQEGYGWADREAKIARIPIDRAMDILARKGLPTRDPSGSPAARPNSANAAADGGVLTP